MLPFNINYKVQTNGLAGLPALAGKGGIKITTNHSCLPCGLQIAIRIKNLEELSGAVIVRHHDHKKRGWMLGELQCKTL